MFKLVSKSLIATGVALAISTSFAVQASAKLETEKDKTAYAIGALYGQSMDDRVSQMADFDLPVDRALVQQGFIDALAGKAELSEEEIRKVLTSLETEMSQRAQAKAQEQANAAKAEGQKFLDENKKREGVITTESGIQYEVLRNAEGAKPKATDTVVVDYAGTLIDGTPFDSSYERGQPATFGLNQVIPGWTEGVQLMPVGSKFKFYIPSELAYGDRNVGSIPPNSVLIFEVELKEIKAPAEGS